MLGKRDRQGRLFSAAIQLGREVVERLGFYGKLALRGDDIFQDDDFGGVYCRDNGRPSVPPSILAMARLLQHYDGVSDAETVERCRYDLRWKVALDLDLASVEARHRCFRPRRLQSGPLLLHVRRRFRRTDVPQGRH